MAILGLDYETFLDITVNIIPMLIILFFAILLFAIRPWPREPLVMVITFGLHAVPFVGLGLLTYIAARAIGPGATEAA